MICDVYKGDCPESPVLKITLGLEEAGRWVSALEHTRPDDARTINRMIRKAREHIFMEGEPNCPGEACPFCTSQACMTCGAGIAKFGQTNGSACEHDVLERHDFAAARARIEDRLRQGAYAAVRGEGDGR